MNKPQPHLWKMVGVVLLSLSAWMAQAQTLATTRVLPPPSSQEERGESLKVALEKIAQAYQVNFAYDEQTVEKIKVRRSTLIGKSLEDALNQVLKPLDLSYKQLAKDYYVIHRRKDKDTKSVTRKSLHEFSLSPPPVLPAIHRVNMPPAFRTKLLEKAISGKVSDMAEGTTLPGVNVVAKGTTLGTVTDIDGNYAITVPDGTETLVFSSVGYVSEEVSIGNQSVINVQMAPDIQSLQEVVVVGYGTQQRRDLTGSVSQVKSSSFDEQPLTSIDQALQGRAAGVFVGSGGGPGAPLDIRIRGANSINAGVGPLFVIDGVPMSQDNPGGNDAQSTLQVGGAQNIMSTLNPDDIASIEVLKDASATAIYGSRGSNGVVLITTKTGKMGKPKVSVNYYYGISESAGKLDLMRADEYAAMTEAFARTRDQIGQVNIYAYGEGADTDWQDAVLRTGSIQNATVGLSGGSEAVRYNISANYFDNQGLFINSYLTRFSARLNLDFDLSDRLSLGTRINVSKQNSAFPSASTHGANMRYVISAPPTYPVRDENGDYTDSGQLTGQNIFNPVQILETVQQDNPNYRFLSNVFGEYKFTDWLSYKLTVGADILQEYRKTYQPTDALYGANSNGFAQIRVNDGNNWVITNQLSFKKEFNKNHRLDATAVYEVAKNRDQFAALTGRDFFTDNFGLDNLGIAIDPGVSNGMGENTIISYLGRVNYTWLDRYLFTVSTRIDGASRFGPDKKWGVFPSGAFAWRVSDEPFMQDVNLFSDLKFRVSYGVVGNQRISNYQSLPLVGLQEYGTPEIRNALRLTRLGNSALGWEQSEQFDVGVDLGFLENRILVTADYYNNKTSDMLLALSIPTSTGFNELLSNRGGMDVKGFEFSVTSRNLTGALKWTTSANFSAVRGIVTDLANQPPVVINGSWRLGGGTNSNDIIALVEEGQPLNNFVGYVADGIIQHGDESKIENRHLRNDNRRAGDVKYVDLNNDGLINQQDLGVIGNANPDFFFGLTNTFNYRNFELSVFIQGSQGNDIMNSLNGYTRYGLNPASNMLSSTWQNRWQGSNPTNEYTNFNYSRRLSTLYVEDASYVRLQMVSLSYNLPNQLPEWVTNAQIYVTANNLYTFTRYTGYDPGFASTDSNIVRGFDSGFYPLERTFVAGVKLQF